MITAIVPLYNHARELPRCLNALLVQSVKPRIVVIDDGSTDDSYKVAKSFPVEVYQNESNRGVVFTINRGLSLAEEYVTFCPADDVVHQGFIEKTLSMLRWYPKVALCDGMAEWVCSVTGARWIMGKRMPSGLIEPSQMVRLAKQFRLAIQGTSCVWRTDILRGNGGYQECLGSLCDWHVAYKLAFVYGMCHIPEVLSTFNIGPRTYGAKQKRQQIKLLVQSLLGDKELLESGMLGDLGLASLHLQTVNIWFVLRLMKRLCERAGRLLPIPIGKFILRTVYGH